MIKNTCFYVEFHCGMRNQVTCFIFRGKNTIPVGVGHAYCRAEDKFDIRMGEKISLKRALADSKASKKNRQQAWEDYLQSRSAKRAPEGFFR